MERRTIRRRHLMFHLRVFDAETGEQLGLLSDISSAGLRLTGERHLPIDRTYRLQMRMPPAIANGRRFEFPATVAWIEDDQLTEFCDIGFRDMALEEDQRRALERLIDTFELRD